MWNDRGVSAILGFVLLLLIGMIFLSVVQTQYVPSVLKSVAMKHTNDLTFELFELRNAVVSGKKLSVTFKLGVTYPKYIFLLTPQSLASSIFCEREPVSFNANLSYPIEYTYNSSSLGINDTSRIVIFVNNFVQPDYYLVYENSAIFKFVWSLNSTRPLILSDQKMFVGNTVNIFIINSTNFKSISTTSNINVALVPVSVGKAYAKNLTVSFESVYPEYWNYTLSRLGYTYTTIDRLNSYNKSYNIGGSIVTVHVNDANVNIYYYVIASGVGITSYSYNISVEPWKMIKVTYNDVNPIQINAGQSVTLGVRIIDKFLSPVIGAEVQVNSNGGTVRPSVTYTDSDGEAYAIFTSNTAGTYTVTFSSSGVNSVTYNVSVIGGGAVGNVSVSLSCPEGWYTDGYSQKTIVVRVTSNGVPLPGCDVIFSANSPNVVFNPSRTTTNESGYAVTTISQNVTGSNYYTIYVYALSAYASHDILLNTTVPPDVHILKVYIENLMSQPLNDFQVRIVIDRSILSGMQNDGSDLRVAEILTDPYSQTQGLLPFWIESINSSDVVLWVKVNLSAGENKTIYVYWNGINTTSESNFTSVFDLFEDNFSTNPNTNGKWIVYRYSNDPNNEFWWDSTKGWVYLTKAVNNKGSFAFANVRGYPIRVEFRYKVGQGTSLWENADGLAFGFDKDITPYKIDGKCSAGGSLALRSYNHYSDGWALELDGYDNGNNDPSGDYIAIARTNTFNGGYPRPADNYYNTKAVEDWRWHTIEMNISGDYSYVKDVKLDGVTILSNVPIQRLGYGYFGIGGATGGANNNHIIDYIKVWYFKYAEIYPKVTIGEKIQ
ncbi:DUF2341 domain-containing protein [Archaeoglobus sp.]